jgi:hypothetical protein
MLYPKGRRVTPLGAKFILECRKNLRFNRDRLSKRVSRPAMSQLM